MYLQKESINDVKGKTIMAHFAKVVDGTVTQVIVAEQEFFETFVDSSPGEWIQTSYNTRGGVHYDPQTGEPSEDQSKALKTRVGSGKNIHNALWGFQFTYNPTTIAYATSANTIANGCGYLGIDNKNVYASNRFANTSPSCVVLDQATFTLGISNVFVHTGSLLGTASSYGTPVPDYQGNVFLVGQAATNSSTNGFVGVFLTGPL